MVGMMLLAAFLLSTVGCNGGDSNGDGRMSSRHTRNTIAFSNDHLSPATATTRSFKIYFEAMTEPQDVNTDDKLENFLGEYTSRHKHVNNNNNNDNINNEDGNNNNNNDNNGNNNSGNNSSSSNDNN